MKHIPGSASQLREVDVVALWGEMFVLLNNEHHDELLPRWATVSRGGAGAFAFGPNMLRVRTSRLPFRHEVALQQGDASEVDSHLISLCVENSKNGLRLADMLVQLLARARDRDAAYAAIARRGVPLQPIGPLDVALTLSVQPAMFSARDVPRISGVDSNVTDLEYRLALDPGKALGGGELLEATTRYGLGRICH